MTVYVDDWQQKARVGRINGVWSHLTADTDDELHAFAARLGLRRSWFQEDPHQPVLNHYDVTESKRQQAIRMGAEPITAMEAGHRAARLIDAGQRGDSTGQGWFEVDG